MLIHWKTMEIITFFQRNHFVFIDSVNFATRVYNWIKKERSWAVILISNVYNLQWTEDFWFKGIMFIVHFILYLHYTKVSSIVNSKITNLGNLVRGNLVRAKISLRVSIIVKKNNDVNCITGVFSNTLLHAFNLYQRVFNRIYS